MADKITHPEDNSPACETVDISSVEDFSIFRPTPHGNKLRGLLENEKLPDADRPRVEEQLERYKYWISSMEDLQSSGSRKVSDLVDLLNEYKKTVELDLIWDSTESFLYRQKGQLKLDNTVLEEWFPWLVDFDIIPELQKVPLKVGPAKAFASAYFTSILAPDQNTPGLTIRSKDQDFTIGKEVFVRTSFDSRFEEFVEPTSTYIAYIAAEIKTNLDKTMFEGAMTTSHDLAIAAPGSRYFLICEYLDMTPINSAGTDIEEVLILRGKRRGSHIRRQYANPDYRRDHRSEFEEDLNSTPIRGVVVKRFVDRVRTILKDQVADVSGAVERGYF